MPETVVLHREEEEALVRAVESGVRVQRLHHFFVWTRSHVQGLVPHDTLLCMQFDDDEALRYLECLNSQPVDANALDRLCNIESGLGIRLAQTCRNAGALPMSLGTDGTEADDELLRGVRAELCALNWAAATVHGTGRSHAGGTFFALLSRAAPPSPRHLHALNLLVPVLHWAFYQVIANGDASDPYRDVPRALSARELEILGWVTHGKTNPEVAEILGLSTLTVKNHLQRIYKKLQVRNRIEAVAKSRELKLPAPIGNPTLVR
jgi:transcriptional regulator EpsA